MSTKVIVAVILFGTFISVNSLQCYECVGCPDDSLTENMVKTCYPEASGDHEYSCVKITVKVLGFDHIARGCTESTIGGKEFCEYVTQGQSPDISCCQCNTDKCLCDSQ